MDLDHFYSDEIEIWETILGEKMHYHYAISSKDNDPFDQAIINLFPYLEDKLKILDCGCGWGGPGKLIKEKFNCDVTGVTISKTQSQYIKSFPVIHQDLNDFIPPEKYDIAIFIESFTHVFDSASMLKRFYNNVDSILIKDYVSDYWKAIPEWGMQVRSKNTFINELEQAGYVVKDYYEIENFFQPAIDFWMKNLMKLDPSLIKGHIKHLFDLCFWYKYKKHRVPSMNQCVIYATK
jgi:hypothetical protein